MDEGSKKHLDSILIKQPEELTPEEQAFLKARRTYLTRTQLEDYITILNQTPQNGTENKNGQTPKTHPRRVTKN